LSKHRDGLLVAGLVFLWKARIISFYKRAPCSLVRLCSRVPSNTLTSPLMKWMPVLHLKT